MLGNLKEFISVVQDGITSNNNLRQTLQEVQKIKYIFREKSKPVNECSVNYGAGGKLLEIYQQQWSELHENADRNAVAAEEADKLILAVHKKVNSQLVHASNLAQGLSTLPKLTAVVEECIDSLKEVQVLLQVVEGELTDLEDLIDRSNMAKWKLDHNYHFSLYKEKKLNDLEGVRGQLAKENTLRSNERERKQLSVMQVQQNTSEVAFKNDVAHYLATGNILHSSRPSSEGLSLDQVLLDNTDTDLEKFLNS